MHHLPTDNSNCFLLQTYNTSQSRIVGGTPYFTGIEGLHHVCVNTNVQYRLYRYFLSILYRTKFSIDILLDIFLLVCSIICCLHMKLSSIITPENLIHGTLSISNPYIDNLNWYCVFFSNNAQKHTHERTHARTQTP